MGLSITRVLNTAFNSFCMRLATPLECNSRQAREVGQHGIQHWWAVQMFLKCYRLRQSFPEFSFDSVRLAMKVIVYACQMQYAKLAALNAAAQVPTVEQYKAATRSAIQAQDLFTHFEKVGLIGEFEDAWAQLEAG